MAVAGDFQALAWADQRGNARFLCPRNERAGHSIGYGKVGRRASPGNPGGIAAVRPWRSGNGEPVSIVEVDAGVGPGLRGRNRELVVLGSQGQANEGDERNNGPRESEKQTGMTHHDRTPHVQNREQGIADYLELLSTSGAGRGSRATDILSALPRPVTGAVFSGAVSGFGQFAVRADAGLGMHTPE